MSEATPTIELLRALPRSERRDALEVLTVREFKATLLMTDDEELPLDRSYFELGFTSLRITEVKQRLETLLGRGISANVLFRTPTVERFMEHLTSEVLADLFGPATVPATVTGPADEALWNDVLEDLYRT